MKKHIRPMSNHEHQLVTENLNLVYRVLGRYVQRGQCIGVYAWDDLVQIGRMGLCKAAQEYKPGRCGFPTYAYRIIQNEIVDAFVRANREKARMGPQYEDGMEVACIQEPNELEDNLLEAKSRMTGVAVYGVDAILKMAKGYTSREIGKEYGVSCHVVTAWISKARKALKKDKAFMKKVSGY